MYCSVGLNFRFNRIKATQWQINHLPMFLNTCFDRCLVVLCRYRRYITNLCCGAVKLITQNQTKCLEGDY